MVRLASYLPFSLLLFVAACFAMPTKAAYAFVFYVAVWPPAIAWCATAKLPRSPVALLAALMITWSAATLLWGEDPRGKSGIFALGAMATLFFVIAVIGAARDEKFRDRLLSLLVIAGTLNAMLSLVLERVSGPPEPRLLGWGVTAQPVLGAAVMSVCLLSALHRGCTGRRFYLLAILPMLAFMLMTRSRGPLFATFLGALFLAAPVIWRRRRLALFTLQAGALTIGLFRDHLSDFYLARGTSHRLDIWQHSFALIAQRPIFGHGLAAGFQLDNITFPHSLTLSLLFYSGIVGLLLFAALAFAVTLALWQARATPDARWLAALWINALVCGLTDFGQITKGPGPLWVILWLLIGMTKDCSFLKKRTKKLLLI